MVLSSDVSSASSLHLFMLSPYYVLVLGTQRRTRRYGPVLVKLIVFVNNNNIVITTTTILIAANIYLVLSSGQVS